MKNSKTPKGNKLKIILNPLFLLELEHFHLKWNHLLVRFSRQTPQMLQMTVYCRASSKLPIVSDFRDEQVAF